MFIGQFQKQCLNGSARWNVFCDVIHLLCVHLKGKWYSPSWPLRFGYVSSGHVQLVHGGEWGRWSDSARSDQRWPEARSGLRLHWTGEHKQQPSQLNSEKRRVLPAETQKWCHRTSHTVIDRWQQGTFHSKIPYCKDTLLVCCIVYYRIIVTHALTAF